MKTWSHLKSKLTRIASFKRKKNEQVSTEPVLGDSPEQEVPVKEDDFPLSELTEGEVYALNSSDRSSEESGLEQPLSFSAKLELAPETFNEKKVLDNTDNADENVENLKAPIFEETLKPKDVNTTSISSDMNLIAESLNVALADKTKKKKTILQSISDFFKTKGNKTIVPIRVLIGFLPEVLERDALEYAAGMAEKYFEQVGLAYLDAFKYNNGYIYEIHEGGSGKAFAPEIISYFDKQGEYTTGEFVAVVLKTATRKVEVRRTRDGLNCVLLPENSSTPISEQIEPKIAMSPAFPKRTGLLVFGASVFILGFLALLISAFVARYQPYATAPDRVVEKIELDKLPSSQWDDIKNKADNSMVTAVKYENKGWHIESVPYSTAPSPEVVAFPPSVPELATAASAPELATAASAPQLGASVEAVPVKLKNN